MVIGERPVYKIQVNIFELKILKRFLAGNENISLAVHVIPNFRCDEKFFALHDTVYNCLGKNTADKVLVAIYSGTVKHAVTAANCACNSIGNFGCSKSVGTKCTHTYAGYLLAGCKSFLWDADR